MKKKLLHTVLIVLVLATWGAVTYQLIGGTGDQLLDGEPVAAIDDIAVQIRARDAGAQFRPSLRDPFVPPPYLMPAEASDEEPVIEVLPPAPTPPPVLRLIGLHDDGAIISDASERIYFVGLGDSVGMAHVVEIGQTEVVVSVQGERFLVPFGGPVSVV
ncbi:MAG: hypothetical protein AAF752_12405, partial [Bacteroidota bacterium]